MSAASDSPGRLGIILFTLFIDMVGFGIVIPILPLYAERFDATGFQIGALLAVYSLCQFVFAPLVGAVSDRVGRRPVLLVSVAGTALGFFLMGAAGALWMLFVARIIDGVSGANIGTAQAYIADITTPTERARAMGLVGAVFGVGFVLGPAIGGVLSGWSVSAPFYFAGCLAVLNFLFMVFRLPESLGGDVRARSRSGRGLREVLGHVHGPLFKRLVVCQFLSICGFAIMTAVWALLLNRRFGYDEQHAGYLFAYIGVIAVIVQGGILRRILRTPNREAVVAVGGALLTAISLLALAFVTNLAGLLTVSAGIAVGNSLLAPTLNGIASRGVDPGWQGRALGVMQSAGSLGRSIGPLLGGWFLAFDAGRDASLYARSSLVLSAGILFLSVAALLSVPRLLTGLAAESRTAKPEPVA